MLRMLGRSAFAGCTLFFLSGCGAIDSIEEEFKEDSSESSAPSGNEPPDPTPPTPDPTASAPPPTATSAPEPEPTAEPTSPPSSGEFPDDLSRVVWLHADVSDWAITSGLDVTIGGGTVRLAYDKANVWPARDGLNANPWIFVNRGGTWYGATWEWLRRGQITKPMAVVNGAHIKKRPLNDFRPVSGEVYGFMVSGLARDSTRNVRERTPIVMVRWP